MATAVTAVTWVFALLLATAGAQKLTDPAATGAALQAAKLPSDARLVRLLGIYELVLATSVLAVGGAVAAALLAATYAAFAGFAWRQSHRGAGCGCFGKAEAPTTPVHVVVNVAAASAAAASAWASPFPLLDVVDDPMALIVALPLLLTAAALLRLTLTALPELRAAQALFAVEDEAPA